MDGHCILHRGYHLGDVVIVAAKVTFVLFCIVASTIFLVWLAAVVIFTIVETRQEKAKRRRRGANHRVGGVLPP